MAQVASGRGAVVHFYPGGLPGQGSWRTAAADAAQIRDFDAHHPRLVAMGLRLVGVSGQAPEYQVWDMQQHVHLEHPLLSDPDLHLARALGLPTYEVGGARLYQRQTLVAQAGRVTKVFGPPNAAQVLSWLTATANTRRLSAPRAGS